MPKVQLILTRGALCNTIMHMFTGELFGVVRFVPEKISPWTLSWSWYQTSYIVRLRPLSMDLEHYNISCVHVLMYAYIYNIYTYIDDKNVFVSSFRTVIKYIDLIKPSQIYFQFLLNILQYIEWQEFKKWYIII